MASCGGGGRSPLQLADLAKAKAEAEAKAAAEAAEAEQRQKVAAEAEARAKAEAELAQLREEAEAAAAKVPPPLAGGKEALWPARAPQARILLSPLWSCSQRRAPQGLPPVCATRGVRHRGCCGAWTCAPSLYWTAPLPRKTLQVAAAHAAVEAVESRAQAEEEERAAALAAEQSRLEKEAAALGEVRGEIRWRGGN